MPQWKAVDESAWKLVDEPPPSKYQPIYDQLKSGDPRGVEAAKRLTPAEQQEFFDFQKNANKPNLHDRPDANILGVDQAGITNDASRLPASLRGPAAFGGSLVGSALEAFSAPESVATLGIGRVPNMNPNYTKVPFRETIKGLGRMIEQSPVGGVKSKVLGKVLQQVPSKQAAGIERYAPSVSGYEIPKPLTIDELDRGYSRTPMAHEFQDVTQTSLPTPKPPRPIPPEPAERLLPGQQVRIDAMDPANIAKARADAAKYAAAKSANAAKAETGALPESFRPLVDNFSTGSNAGLNANLLKAKILMKTRPELSLEQAMKIVATQ